MKFNPEHELVECRGWEGAVYADNHCNGRTKAVSGLCSPCRDRISALYSDLQLVKEWGEEGYE